MINDGYDPYQYAGRCQLHSLHDNAPLESPEVDYEVKAINRQLSLKEIHHQRYQSSCVKPKHTPNINTNYGLDYQSMNTTLQTPKDLPVIRSNTPKGKYEGGTRDLMNDWEYEDM